MGKHILIWFIVLAVLPVLYPMLAPPKTMARVIAQDYRSAVSLFGGKASIDRDVTSVYQKNLIAIARFANEFRDRHDDSNRFRTSGDPLGEAIADIPGDWADSVKLQAYNVALRLVILSRWGVWLLLPMLMSIAVGFLERKLKYDLFTPPIPPIYNTSAHLLLALSAITLAWLICPFHAPISLIPAIAVVFGVLVGLGISNYPAF